MNFWKGLEEFTATDERARRIVDLYAAGHMTSTEAETEIIELYRDRDFIFFVVMREKGRRKKWVAACQRYRPDAEQIARASAARGALSVNNRPLVYSVTPVLRELFCKD